MEKTPFMLNLAYWHEVRFKLDVEPLRAALNQHLRLSDYGTGVEQVFFTFIAVRPTNTLHPDEVRYRRKAKTVELSLNLNYSQVFTADKDRVLEMMAELFVASIDIWKQFRIPDFDIERFRRDVQKLFACKGWLVAAEEAVQV